MASDPALRMEVSTTLEIDRMPHQRNFEIEMTILYADKTVILFKYEVRVQKDI